VNIFQQEDVIKGMPDQALMKEAQAPTGRIPQYLVVSEIQRRADMRKRFAGEQQSMPQSTVKDQIVSGGIVGVGQQRQAPQGGMMPQMPAAQPMPPQQPMPVPPQPMPQQMPQQAMSNGGVVRMFDGRGTPFTPQGSTLEELAESIYDYQRPRTGPRGRREGETREDVISRVLGPDAYQPPSFLAGRGARPKFIESAVQSGMLEKYLPKEENQFLETKVNEQDVEGGMFAPIGGTLADLPGSGQNAINADSAKLGLKTSTTLDPVTIDAGLNTTTDTDQVNKDLVKDLPDIVSRIDASTSEKLPSPDLTPVRTAISELETATERAKSVAPSDYVNLLREYNPNFGQYAPDFSGLIQDQELKAKKIREDARKDAGAQALIQLGAGILEGNVGEGLRGAGKASSDIMAQARAEASAEERLAHNMQLSAQEARMNLGVLGENATIDKINKNNEMIIADYRDAREMELRNKGLDVDLAKAKVNAESALLEFMHGADVAAQKIGLEKLVSMASVLRYGDLREEEKGNRLRSIMQFLQDPFERWFEKWEDENPEATTEQQLEAANKYIDQMLTRWGIETGTPTKKQASAKVDDKQIPESPNSDDPLGVRE
jgi:hypothetical protein